MNELWLKMSARKEETYRTESDCFWGHLYRLKYSIWPKKINMGTKSTKSQEKKFVET